MVLDMGESPRYVFQIIATCFAGHLPKFLIYDNACNIYEYFMNYDPSYLLDMQIISDGLHWPNHTNCCASFHSQLYPLKGIASIVHEQMNARLDKLKLTSLFKTWFSFFHTLRFATDGIE